MKKLFSIIFAVTLAANLALSAAAAPSPTGASIIQSITAVDSNNNPVQIRMGVAPSAVVRLARNTNTLRAALGFDYQEGMVPLAVRDVIAPPNTPFPLDIRFDLPAVTPDSNCRILHWNGRSFDNVPVVIGGGYVIGTFDSLSPVVIVLDDKTATAITQVYGYDPSVDPKSPQTGAVDMTWIYIASTLCLCGSAFAFAAGRKKAIASK